MTLVRSFLLVQIAVLLLGCGASAQTPSASDEAAVRAVVMKVDEGYRKSNAQQAASAYAEDADWINAFGVELRGREQIQKFLTKFLSAPEITVSQDSPLVIKFIRFPSPDVAVALSYLQTTGQKSEVDGKVLPIRHTREMQVLKKQHGQWLIVSDLIADENQNP